jgi:hypothetical protein
MFRETPPTFIFLQTSRSCNLRCTRCEFWKLEEDREDDGRIPWQRQKEIVEEFAEIGGTTLVTCGGEPMLNLEAWFRLHGLVRSLGMTGISVTNGTVIKSAEIADRVVREGPAEISLSIDGPSAATHDVLRGVDGAFDKVVRSLRLLVEARERLRQSGGGPGPKIYAMTILGEEIYRELPAFYELILNDIQADKLKMNVQQPSFGQDGGADLAYAKGCIRDVDGLMTILRECSTRYNLNLSTAWLRDVEMYYRSLHGDTTVHLGWKSHGEGRGQTKEHICNTYNRNIMVDLAGEARLCFSTHYPGTKLVAPGDLRTFWYEGSLPTRERMLGCNRYCGISHSVRRTAATKGTTHRQWMSFDSLAEE